MKPNELQVGDARHYEALLLQDGKKIKKKLQ